MMHEPLIDIFQLPIPDWGLECPRCRYTLFALSTHRCPECGLTLDMREIVKPWTALRPPRFDGSERPLPDFGFDCESCRVSLAGATADACPACATRFDLAGIVPSKTWFPITATAAHPITLPHLQAIFVAEQLPHVPIDQRTMHEHVLGQRSIGTDLLVPREYWFEVRWLIAAAICEINAVRASSTADWQCSGCGEKVPANFDICWNCAVERPLAQ